MVQLSSAKINARPVGRRRKSSSGQALVESVFTLLPTFALIFGLTDLSLMIFR